MRALLSGFCTLSNLVLSRCLCSRCVLTSALASPAYSRVIQLGRRSQDVPPDSPGFDKLASFVKVDFDKLLDGDAAEQAVVRDQNLDAVLITLGTTRANAGSFDNFVRIDRECAFFYMDSLLASLLIRFARRRDCGRQGGARRGQRPVARLCVSSLCSELGDQADPLWRRPLERWLIIILVRPLPAVEGPDRRGPRRPWLLAHHHFPSRCVCLSFMRSDADMVRVQDCSLCLVVARRSAPQRPSLRSSFSLSTASLAR